MALHDQNLKRSNVFKELNRPREEEKSRRNKANQVADDERNCWRRRVQFIREAASEVRKKGIKEKNKNRGKIGKIEKILEN